MIITRRHFSLGLISLIAAPAIVRASNIMPVKSPIITDLLPEITGHVGYHSDPYQLIARFQSKWIGMMADEWIDNADLRWKRLVERIIERGVTYV